MGLTGGALWWGLCCSCRTGIVGVEVVSAVEGDGEGGLDVCIHRCYSAGVLH